MTCTEETFLLGLSNYFVAYTGVSLCFACLNVFAEASCSIFEPWIKTYREGTHHALGRLGGRNYLRRHPCVPLEPAGVITPKVVRAIVNRITSTGALGRRAESLRRSLVDAWSAAARSWGREIRGIGGVLAGRILRRRVVGCPGTRSVLGRSTVGGGVTGRVLRRGVVGSFLGIPDIIGGVFWERILNATHSSCSFLKLKDRKCDVTCGAYDELGRSQRITVCGVSLAYERLSSVFPGVEIPSYKVAASRVAFLSEFQPTPYDCCINSCCCYVASYTELTECPYCKEPRYSADKRPRKRFNYIPIIPRLKAYYRNPSFVAKLRYRNDYVSDPNMVNDVMDGSHYQVLRNTFVKINGNSRSYKFFKTGVTSS
ncbi:transposase domain-containing protein [Salix suchowensis]|nr:transposase domain-containing protein [Salix suchowensis]